MTYLNRIEHPAYYNDFDEGSVEWLRELMKQGLIPAGEIDARSILEVQASDLIGFTQAHFFAGIAGWPLALRLAGIPVDVSLWTGSPPCQPFSVAGLQESREDERHLAPHFVDLVGVARPGVLFGEQVASAEVFGKAPKRSRGNVVPPPDWAWIDDLSDRLEAARYTVGASDFPSAGVGAPHIRQRTYIGAVSEEWLVNRIGSGLEGFGRDDGRGCEPGWLREDTPGSASETGTVGERQPGPTNGFWGNADWLLCRDENWRAVEPRTFPLADGFPARVGLLRGYGNAINPRQAKVFIKAFFEAVEIFIRGEPKQVADLSLDGLIV
jgi:DNA (cytosine-5)-methyltransferase 1